MVMLIGPMHMTNWSRANSPNTRSSVVVLVDPSSFTAEQMKVPMSSEVVLRRVRVLSCVLLSTWTVLMVTWGGAVWTSAPSWSQVMLEEG